MKVFFMFFLIAFCSLNFFAQSNITKEEYVVYEKVFESVYADNFKPEEFKTSFVISEITVKSDFMPQGLMDSKTILDYSNEKIPINIKGLMIDFIKKNKYSTKLENQFAINYKFDVITKKEIETLLEQGKKEYKETLKKCDCLFLDEGFSFQPLYKKYPNSYGYYNVSRIGFSSDKKAAAVFVNKVSGDQGSAMFYILKKDSGKWLLFEKIHLFFWIT